ncbi:hypothetical protein BVC80_8445g1 [Macleaya cordata]|uniref:Uncharacterized protein n=1 Tax=Macleaya cordata TaxID=56857 RepID=A0A200Q350_MACCD|nr:hypothetical protein BVC80_8445g1 [Macleaya cordata]
MRPSVEDRSLLYEGDDHSDSQVSDDDEDRESFEERALVLYSSDSNVIKTYKKKNNKDNRKARNNFRAPSGIGALRTRSRSLSECYVPPGPALNLYLRVMTVDLFLLWIIHGMGIRSFIRHLRQLIRDVKFLSSFSIPFCEVMGLLATFGLRYGGFRSSFWRIFFNNLPSFMCASDLFRSTPFMLRSSVLTDQIDSY